MKELKDLRAGDKVALFRKDMILKDFLINQATVKKEGKKNIAVALKGDRSYYYSIKTGNLICQEPYSNANFIEPWDREKHQSLWEKCVTTTRTIRAKNRIIMKIQALETQLDTLDEQVGQLELLTAIDSYIDNLLKEKG